MAQRESQHIDLGPGGSIPVTDENQELLERIKDAPPLKPEQLLVLANFYHVYQTNTFLADHLTLIGETKLVRLSLPEVWDKLEDHVFGFETTPEERQEKLNLLNLNLNFRIYIGDAYKGQRRSKYPLTYADYEIKCVHSLIPGLGLLIEIRPDHDPHIIGVCPELES